MSDLRANLEVRLRDRVSRSARRASANVKRFGRDAERSFSRADRRAKMMNRTMASTSRHVRGLVAGFAGAAALRSAARHAMNWETRLARLGVQAKADEKDIRGLRKEIFAVAKSPDIKVDPSEITAAIETIVEKTGDLDYARRNIGTIGEAIQATGARGRDIGALVAEFKKFGIEGPRAVKLAINTLTAQGKAGSFTLQNLATQGERLAAAYVAFGGKGQKGIREMGGTMQMIRGATGSAEQAATAMEALLRTLSKAESLKKLEGKLGMNRLGLIYDPAKLAQGKKELLDITTIIKNLVKVTDGDTRKLSEVFDAEAMRALNAFVVAYKKTGDFRDFDRFLKVKTKGDEITKDAARVSKTTGAQAQNLRTKWQELVVENMTGPLRTAATAVQEFSGEIVSAGVAITGVVAAWKVAKGIKGLVSGDKKKPAGKVGRAGRMAVQPVRIVGPRPLPVMMIGPGGRRRKGGRSAGGGQKPKGSPAAAAPTRRGGSRGGGRMRAGAAGAATVGAAYLAGQTGLGGEKTMKAIGNYGTAAMIGSVFGPAGALTAVIGKLLVDTLSDSARPGRDMHLKGYKGDIRRLPVDKRRYLRDEAPGGPSIKGGKMFGPRLSKLDDSGRTFDSAARTIQTAAAELSKGELKVAVKIDVTGPAGTGVRTDHSSTGKIATSVRTGRNFTQGVG